MEVFLNSLKNKTIFKKNNKLVPVRLLVALVTVLCVATVI